MARSHGSDAPGRVLLGLAALGMALLLAAWVVGTQPFAAPDEASHYLRALNLSQGHLLGRRATYPSQGATPAQLAYVDHDTRAVFVAAQSSPPDVQCRDGRADTMGCVEVTEVGNYPPLSYLLPAVALKLAPRARTGLWLARVGSALQCFAFILLAFALLFDGSLSSLLGLFAAITPMVLFVCSVLNPNGLEVAAGLAFAAGVLRISRGPAAVRPWVLAATAISGVVTVLAWQLGPVFVVADLVLLVALLGVDGVRVLAGGRRTAGWWTVAAIVAAVLVWAVYGHATRLTHTGFGISPIRANLREGVTQAGYVLRDSVGSFGSLTVHLPLGVYWLWWLLVLALVAVALWRATDRERAVLVATVALALAFPVLFYAWVYRFSGFGLQGRYTLPVLMLIPLLAGELVHRHPARRAGAARGSRLAVSGVLALIAGVQGYAWWDSARAAAGARGTVRFYAHAVWSPPLGWGPWIALASLGVLCLLATAAQGLRAPRAGDRPADVKGLAATSADLDTITPRSP